MLLPLAATYSMVSGGPYGLEEIIGDAGYGWALIILLCSRFSGIATSLMIGESGRGGAGRRWLLRLGAGAMGPSGAFKKRGFRSPLLFSTWRSIPPCS